MKKASVFVIIFILLGVSVSSAQDTLWTRTYGSINDEYAYGVTQSYEEGYITVGHGPIGFQIVSTDTLGEVLWTKDYSSSIMHAGKSIIQTDDGNYVIAGYSLSPIDAAIIKINPEGDTIWTREYDRSGESNYLNSVQQTYDGGFISTGNVSYSNGSRLYLIRTDANGDTIWTNTYGSSPGCYGTSVVQALDSTFIVTGSYGNDVYILKVAPNGDALEAKTYGGSSPDWGQSICKTDDNGYAVAGYTESFGAGYADFYLLKLDEFCDTTWTRTYGAAYHDYAYDIKQSDYGSFIIVGYTQESSGADHNVMLVKATSKGDTLWTRIYGGENSDHVFSICQNDSSYIAAGYTESFGSGGADIWLLNIDNRNVDFPSELVHNPSDFIFDVTGDSTATRTFSINSTNQTGIIIPSVPEIAKPFVDFDPDIITISPGDTIDVSVTFDSYGLDYFRTYRTYIFFDTETFGLDDDTIEVKMTTNPPIPITIAMNPHNPPVIVEQGSHFVYNGILTNNLHIPFPYETDIWIMVERQGLYFGPIELWESIPVHPGTITYDGIQQWVSPSAVLGDYTYIAYCGEYPEIMDSSYFEFTVVEGFSKEDNGWEVNGWDYENNTTSLPTTFLLYQNYPNPFNTTTEILYALPQQSKVKLDIYNLSGQKVETLRNEILPTGEHSILWDASSYSSGIYFYKLTAGDKVFTKRMTLLK